MVHELGHVAVHALAPRLLHGSPRTLDSALHEGYADYLSCALRGNPMSAESFTLALERSGLAPGYLEKIGYDPQHPGRRCDSPRRWPEARDPDPHITGMIVSAVLWDFRKEVIAHLGPAAGERRANRVAFRALTLLQPGVMALDDLQDAMVAAERAEGGTELGAIKHAFLAHGVAPPGPRPGEDRGSIPPFVR
jgi:hypothetical protein